MSATTITRLGEAPGGTASASATAGQFVTFGVGAEIYAVSLAQIYEIIRYPDVVRAPLGPPSLEGLANLRGTVLPVLNLRCILGAPDVNPDDATRVVVINCKGQPVGLIVDRMANVVSAEPNQIETADAIRRTIESELLTGVIKARNGGSMALILDLETLIRHEFPPVRTAKAVAVASTQPSVAAGRDNLRELSELQLVSFAIADQEYALPIDVVQEIVQIPEHITAVPNADPQVLGVMTLRDRLLPLVSLRRLFDLPDAVLTDANKIVVVTLAPGVSAGFVMDSVRQVLRVSLALIDPIPDSLNRRGRPPSVTSICRLAGGNRLVSILAAQRLFDVEELRQLQNPAEAQVDTAAGTENTSAGDLMNVMDEDEQLVVFRVMDEEFGVPIASVQEIVRVPDELVRVPRTPAFIEGVVNLRGAVLPVVDQRLRFGLAPAERNDRQRIVVFLLGGVRTGVIVDSVSQVMRVPQHLIGPAPELSAAQNRLIRRVVNLADQKRMILMLEVDQLLDLGELSAVSQAAAA